MGLYDTVTFRCPKCNGPISEQSKAGACDLLCFDSGSVPLSIAGDLEGVSVWCRPCNAEWRIKLDAPQTVRMSLELPATEDEYD